jgi:hypothetical protein
MAAAEARTNLIIKVRIVSSPNIKGVTGRATRPVALLLSDF